MPQSQRQTMPFRRPASVWPHSHAVDPADMGADYALEMMLTPPEASGESARSVDARTAHGDSPQGD